MSNRDLTDYTYDEILTYIELLDGTCTVRCKNKKHGCRNKGCKTNIMYTMETITRHPYDEDHVPFKSDYK